MKKNIVKTLFSCCLLASASSAYALSMDKDSNMSANSPEMTIEVGLGITENDVLSNLNSEDKAMFNQFDTQQKAFIIKLINMAPKIQMARDKTMDSQSQLQQNRNTYNQR